MIRPVKSYRYLFDCIVKPVINENHFPYDEINLIGGRKSGKSVSVQIAIGTLVDMCRDINKKVGLFFFRYQTKDANELYDEIIDALNLLEVHYVENKTRLKIKVGLNEIRVIGLNSQNKSNKAKKSGLARVGGCSHIIRVFEECFEFPQNDVLALKEAVRGLEDNVNILDIHICNPWAKSSWFVSYCGKHQNWDVNQLKNTGEQFGSYEIKLDEGFTKKVIFHYTNWRVAKDVLGQSDIMSILDTWNYDKRRAMTTDWGLPGYEEGAIYTHLLGHLGSAIYQEHEYLVGGLDYGWGTKNHSSKTVCYFMGATLDNGIDIYGEFVSDNRQTQKAPDVVAEAIIRFYYEQMSIYCNKVGAGMFYPLKVRCDYQNIGIIALLNEKAKQFRCDAWLKFVPCTKEFKTEDRIDLTTAIMGKSMLRLAPQVQELKSNMESAYYEDIETRKRAKRNDDGLNAFEYGCESFIFKMVKSANVDTRYLLGRR